MKIKMDQSSEALVKLLFDENPAVAVQAMDQLLKNDLALKEILSIYQDSTDELVRKRIHQVSSVLSRRNKKKDFITSVKSGEGPIISQLIQLSSLSNPQLSESGIRVEFSKLVKKLSLMTKDRPMTTELMVDFMRSEHFFVPETALMESRLYMLDMVLQVKLGSAVLLACLAFALGTIFHWQVKFVIYRGEFCLLDNQLQLINPNLSWKVTKLDDLRGCLPCHPNKLVYNLVSILFLIAIQDGEIKLIQLYGALLTELYDVEFEDLPYPVGDSPLPRLK